MQKAKLLAQRFIHFIGQSWRPDAVALFAFSIVIVLIIMAAIGYYRSIRRIRFSLPPEHIRQFVQPVATVTPLPGTIHHTIEGVWTSYESIALELSLEYPKSIYTLSELMEGNRSPVLRLSPTDLDKRERPQAVTYEITVSAAANSRKLSLSSPRQLFGNGPNLSYDSHMLENREIQETRLGDMQAFRVTGCCGGLFGVEADILTIKGGKIYEVLVSPNSNFDGDPELNRRTVEEILHTIQFIH